MREIDDIEGGSGGDSVLAAEFVLGLLTAEQHAGAVRRLASDAAFRAEVALWQQRLSGFDADFADAAPPAAVWSALDRRLFAAAAPRARWWDSLLLWRSLAGMAATVAVVAVGLNLARPLPPAPEEFAAQLVAAMQGQDGFGVEFVALYDQRSGVVKLVGLAGEVAQDRDLELWYIQDDRPAVSMGIVPAMSRTQMPLDAAARAAFEEGTVLAITLEPKGGAPEGVATGPVVSLGRATQI